MLKSGHEVAAVVTRPDAPAGRGLRLAPSPVARRAESAGLEVLKPARPGDPDFLARLRQIAPGCCPITAYGALIPQRAMDIPQHGWVNLHFSLLPAWRGAAPVQHAILHGDDVTGATTFRIVARLKLWPFAGIVTDDHDVVPGPGRLRMRGSQVLVGTGTQPVQLGDVQPHGKRQMPAADWARGVRLDASGAVLG